MMDFTSPELQSILPYLNEVDYHSAVQRVIQDEILRTSLKELFPDLPWNQWSDSLGALKTAEDFQAQAVAPFVEAILKKSSTGLSVSGVQEVKNQSHRFVAISNHRDIVSDPALMAYCFYKNGLGTPFICLGDNLLLSPLVVDLVKINKGLIVKRGLSPRELLRSSQELSRVIDECVRVRQESVWIAQREGRAKDGDDRTQPGVLKMLGMGREVSFLEAMAELHLLPVAISYEFDPCDMMKAREIYLTRTHGSYEKAPLEDLQSMRMGILGFKGRVHVSFGSELTDGALSEAKNLNKRDQVQWLADRIDCEIHRVFRNWPSHYIAYDLIHEGNEMRSFYTEKEKVFFLQRLEKQSQYLLSQHLAQRADLEKIEKICIESYSKSVENQKILSQVGHS